MKLAHCCWPVLASMLPLLSVQAADIKSGSSTSKAMPSYSMMLIGGGASVCSSTEKSQCDATASFSENAKTGALFSVQAKYIDNIVNNEFWPATRKTTAQQVGALLKHLQNKLGGSEVTSRELSRLWRSSEAEYNGSWVSGRELYGSLSEAERNFVFDQLEVEVSERTSAANRKKEQVLPQNSKDTISLGLYQQFVSLATEVSGKRAPRILVVTASGRDPFAAVDYYVDLFKKLGADASWLPVNAAYQAAQRDSAGSAVGCQNYLQHLVQEQGSFQRGRVYPDLLAEQKDFCTKGSAQALEMIRRADAIFFNGGDQSLTYKAFKQPDGSDSKELAQIRTMLGKGELVLAGTSAGTAVMSGGSYLGADTVMISNGQSPQAIYQGAFAAKAPSPGCENNNSCGTGMDENSLTYQANGGLGLFPWGVLDTHFSERGRQGRLLTLVAHSKNTFGFGVDEATALLVGFDKKNPDFIRFSVSGAEGVYVAQRVAETTVEPSRIMAMQSHYFTNGDSFSLQQGQLLASFADWKYAPSTTSSPLLTSGNLFSGDNFRQLANLMCNNQSRTADGSFSVAGKEFKLQLRRDSQSAARSGQYHVGSINKNYCSYRNIQVSVAGN